MIRKADHPVLDLQGDVEVGPGTAAVIVLDARLAVACVLVAAALIAALDSRIVSQASNLGPAIKHLGYVALLGVVAAITVGRAL